LLAKSVAYKLDSYEGLVRLLQHYADPFMDESTFGSLGTKYGIILYPFLAMAGSISAIRAKKEAWAWIGYPWIYLSVFAFFNPLIFRWYLAPPLPVYFLMIFLGAGNLLQIIIQKVNDSSRNSSINIITKSFRILAAAAPMFLLLNAWTLAPDHGPRNPAPEMSFIKLELLYQQAAEILLPNLKPDSVLAAGDVGVLGYITGKQVLDTAGLNSLEASAYYPADPLLYTINYAIPPRLILDYRPEFLVMLEVYGRNGLMIDEQFLERYDLLADIPTDMYGSDGLLIFQRSNRAQGL
jgi:hypothetical protein